MKFKKIFIILASMSLVIMLIGVGIWAYAMNKLSYLNYDLEATYQGSEPQNTETQSPIKEKKPVEVADASEPVFDEDVLNILLIGTDERSQEFKTFARADAMMIASINLKKHTAKLVSLERGIGVSIDGVGDDWLTHVFTYGGADLLIKTINENFNLDIQKYVRVNFYTFEKLIDCIGGVDINLTEAEVKALNNETYTNAVTKKKVVVGLNHLDGYDALQYCRQRFVDDDWHRIKRQRNTIQAAIKQTQNLSILSINKMLNEVLPYVRTNFTQKEISSLLLSAPFFLGVDLEQMTIPVEGSFTGITTAEGKSLFKVDFDANSKVLKEFFYE